MIDDLIETPPIETLKIGYVSEQLVADLAGAVRLAGIENGRLRSALREAYRRAESVRLEAEQIQAMITATLSS